MIRLTSKFNTKNTGRWVLAATIIGSSMAFIDATVILVALPVMQKELNATVTDVQWIVEAYVLFLSALILVGGSFGDRFGRRFIYGSGIAVFSLASVWAGLAPNSAHLIASRVLQGFGGALLVPSSLAIISAHFAEEERGHAIGTWSGYTAITTALGPVVGGWLVENVSWRWAFFINLPIGVLVIVLIFLGVPESRDRRAPETIDWWGALLATLGLGGITYGFIEISNYGWNDSRVVTGLALGTLALILFLFAEVRSPAPMVPLSLFRSRIFSGANLLTFFLYAALGALLFFLPFNLIQVQAYSPTASGAALLPMIFVIFALSRWAGGLVTRHGARWPLVVGSIISAVGFALFALPGVGGSYWLTFFPGVTVLGLGLSIVIPPLTTVVMNSVEDRLVGTASGVNNAISRAAGLLAVAILGVLALTTFNTSLDQRLAPLDIPPNIQAQIDQERIKLAEAEVPENLSESTRITIQGAIAESFVVSFRWIAVISAFMALASAGVGFWMIHDESIKLKSEEHHTELMF